MNIFVEKRRVCIELTVLSTNKSKHFESIHVYGIYKAVFLPQAAAQGREHDAGELKAPSLFVTLNMEQI